jgi:CDP-6-deoxy-D-xylo-4-hexulose-3-dehydrase
MIELIKSSFYNEKDTQEKLANFVIGCRKFSMDKQCKSFEEKFSRKQDRKFSVYVNSGSSANLLLLQALLNLNFIKKGDRVGFSALTWATNVMPIIQLGLEPVPIDCELGTLNISSSKLSEIENLKAVFVTNVLGFSGDLEQIASYCEKEKIILIEDNCEALGSKIGGKLLGNFGLASTFSFFVGHHISTIEGGMVVTDNEDLYSALVMSRSHGWDRNLSPEFQKKIREKFNIDNFYAKYTFYDLAYNIRPTEINGFLGNIQIDYWDEIVEKRSNNFKKIISQINSNKGFVPISYGHMELVSNFAIPVICRDASVYSKYKKRFEENGVEIRPIIAGDITKQPFFTKYSAKSYICSNADFIHKNGFYFGNNPELNDSEIELLIDLLSN